MNQGDGFDNVFDGSGTFDPFLSFGGLNNDGYSYNVVEQGLDPGLCSVGFNNYDNTSGGLNHYSYSSHVAGPGSDPGLFSGDLSNHENTSGGLYNDGFSSYIAGQATEMFALSHNIYSPEAPTS